MSSLWASSVQVFHKSITSQVLQFYHKIPDMSLCGLEFHICEVIRAHHDFNAVHSLVWDDNLAVLFFKRDGVAQRFLSDVYVHISPCALLVTLLASSISLLYFALLISRCSSRMKRRALRYFRVHTSFPSMRWRSIVFGQWGPSCNRSFVQLFRNWRFVAMLSIGHTG